MTKLMSSIRKTKEEQVATAFENVIKMLEARKYTISSQEKEQITAHLQENSSESIINIDINDELGLCLFKKKLPASNIEIPLTPQHKIIITPDIKGIRSYMERNKRVDRKQCEIFGFEHMQVDLLAYCEQPKFRWLTPEEKKEVLERYNTKTKLLPKLCYDDPVTRWYKRALGDVVEITRGNPVMGYEIVYKAVTAKHSHEDFTTKP